MAWMGVPNKGDGETSSFPFRFYLFSAALRRKSVLFAQV